MSHISNNEMQKKNVNNHKRKLERRKPHEC